MGRGHTFRGKTRLLFQVIQINLKKSLIALFGMTIALSEIIIECSLTETLIQSIFPFLYRSERDSFSQRGVSENGVPDIVQEKT